MAWDPYLIGTPPFNPDAEDPRRPRLGNVDLGPFDPGRPAPPGGGGLGRILSDPNLLRGLIGIIMAKGGGKYGGPMAESFQYGNRALDQADRQRVLDTAQTAYRNRNLDLEERRIRSDEENRKLQREQMQSQQDYQRISRSFDDYIKLVGDERDPEKLKKAASSIASLNDLAGPALERFNAVASAHAEQAKRKPAVVKPGYVLTGKNDLLPESEFDRRLAAMPGNKQLVSEIASSGTLGTRYPDLEGAKTQQAAVAAREKPTTPVHYQDATIDVGGRPVKALFDPVGGVFRKPGSLEVIQNAQAYREPKTMLGDFSPGQAMAGDRLAGRFEAASKPFIVVRNQYDRILAAGANQNAVNDLSIIFAYMKILDPSSVVRESEYATAENARGVPDSIRNTYNNVLKGEKLGPEQRKQFIASAGKIYQSATERQKALREVYAGRAMKLGIPADYVVYDVGGSDGDTTPEVTHALQQLLDEAKKGKK